MAEAVGIGTGRAERVFVSDAKAGNLAPVLQDLVRIANARRGARGRTISKARLWAWRKLAAGAATPAERIARLVPGTRGKKWMLTEDVAAALAVHRQPNKHSLSWAAKQVADRMGVSFGSLYARCRRELKKLPAPIFYVGRHTGAALKALQPFRRRDFLSLAPNDVWVGDGHGAKLKVAHPITGNPFVPEVTAILDVATRYCVGWSVALSENCIAVSDALRHGVSRHGVPLIYYSDNGGGQKNKIFDAPVTGMLSAFGIQHETGRPGNPQGRGVIERFWPTVLIPLAKCFATYRGNGADRETLRTTSIEIDRALRVAKQAGKNGEVVALPSKLPTWEQFIAALDSAIESYNQSHRHRSLPKLDGTQHATPAEFRAARLKETAVEICRPQGAELATLFMPSVLRKAQRGEIRFFNGVYFHRDLMLVDGEQVKICYDIHDASRVWVKKISGELIAEAGLGSNRDGYMPKPLIEKLRENRAGRRMALLQSKMDEVAGELNGSALARPAPQAAPDTPEEAAERAALAEELRAANVVSLREEEDEWAVYRRWLAIGRRIEAGAEVSEDERAWHVSYRGSSECRTLTLMAEDFPQKLEERRAG